ncbi:MAG: VOC family protein [Bacilli bacterium]
MSARMLHTCIRVGNLDKSVEFYKSLGFYESRRKEHYDNGFALVFMKLEESSHEIELTYNVGTESYEIGNGFSHVAIEVENLEDEQERCKSLGYEVTDLKGLPGSMPSYFFVTDPDGYKVEVIRKKV